MENDRYLIESMEHQFGDYRCWWGPNSCGYTQNLYEAGRYTEAEAREICEKAGPMNERMWKERDVYDGEAGHTALVVRIP